jgi:hypothetical protein
MTPLPSDAGHSGEDRFSLELQLPSNSMWPSLLFPTKLPVPAGAEMIKKLGSIQFHPCHPWKAFSAPSVFSVDFI